MVRNNAPHLPCVHYHKVVKSRLLKQFPQRCQAVIGVDGDHRGAHQRIDPHGIALFLDDGELHARVLFQALHQGNAHAAGWRPTAAGTL